MAGSTMGPDMPPHPYGPYHSGNEGGPPTFPGGRRHGWPGYFGHPEMRGHYSGEAPDMPPYARASSAPPPSAPTEQQTPPPMAAPQADSNTSARPDCGRRRGWRLWGSSTPQEAGPDSCCKRPADQSSPGNETAAAQQGGFPAGGRHGGCPFSGRGHEMGPRRQAGEAGPPLDPREFGPFSADGSGGPPFHGDGKGFPGFHGDHSGFPGFRGDGPPFQGFPGFQGDHSDFPGSGSGGPPFRGDFSRLGRFRYGYPPFHGYRRPGFYGDSHFQSGPESRYIFREFDFQ